MPPKPPHRCPRQDWRSLLPRLAQIVPWPDDRRGPRTEIEVLENVLGYIQYLQRRVSIAQGGADSPGDGDSAGVASSSEATQSTPGQRLVPYEEEEEVQETDSPWLCPTGLYWDTLDSDERVALSPPPPQQLEGLLGLSPSLLVSPPPRCPPGRWYERTQLSPQAPVVPPQVAVGTENLPRGQHGNPKKKCINGFIMFCRLNRKEYMSAHPGLASTVVTRELAQLWCSLNPAERRPYCQRARRFSRRDNRVVRLVGDEDKDGDQDGDSDTDPPVPLQILLAAHAGTLGGGPLPP